MKTVISEMSSTSNINNVHPTTSSANTDSSKTRRKTARSRSCSNVTLFFDDDGSKSRSAASVSPGEFSRAMSCTDIDSIQLPSYWRMTYTVEGKPYYFNSDRGTVTWIDPRKMEAIRKSHCNLRIKIQSVLRGSRLRGVISGGLPITLHLGTREWFTKFDQSLITQPEGVFKVREKQILLSGGVSSCNEMTKCLLTHQNFSAVEIIGYVKPQLKNFYKIDIIIGRKDFPKILKPETLDENGRAFFETIYGRVYYSEETITQEEGVISWRAVTTGNVRRALSCTDLDTKADLLPKNWKVYFDGNYNAYYRNQLDYKEWTRETPRTATAQLRESFKTAMKRSESTGNLFGCTSWSQSALVIRIHSTTNDCSILGRSCYDDRTLKIYFDTGRPDTFISRSRTPPKTIFKVPNALRMEDHKKTYSTNEMVKLTLTHRHFPPVEVLAYVINKLPDVDILLGQKDIAKVLKPETLDSSNGRTYLDTIYGRVYYSSGLSFRNKNYNRYYFNLGKIQPIYTAVLSSVRKTTRSRSCSAMTSFFDGGGKSKSVSMSPSRFSKSQSCTDIDSIQLPPDWRMSYTDDEKPYYIFKSDIRTATWNDPREVATEEVIRKSFFKLHMKIQSVLEKSCLRGVNNGRPITFFLDTGIWSTIFDQSLLTQPENVFKVKKINFRFIASFFSCNEAIKSWLTHTNCPPVEIIGYVSPQLENSLNVDAVIGRKNLPKILKPEALDSSGRAFFETIYGRVYYSEETIIRTTEGGISWRAVKTGNLVRRSLSCTDLDTVADLLPENWKVDFDENDNAHYRNQHNSEEWSWEAPRTATSQLEHSFETAMKRSESTGNLFGCTSMSQSALVIRIHCTTNDCTILGRSCYDDRTLKIYLDTGGRTTFISRSRTPPSAIFKVPDTLSLLGSGKPVYTNEVAKLIFTHKCSPPVEVFAYVLDELLLGDIRFGPDDIAQILKPEALDNGRAYLNTIYGRVYYSDKLFSKNYNLYYQQLHFGKQLKKTV